MKVIIDGAALAKATTIVEGATNAKGLIPAVGGMLVRADGVAGRVILEGTDLERRVAVAVTAEVMESGVVLVDARRVAEIAREGEGEGAITISAKTWESVTVRAAGSTFRLAGLNPEEFPEAPAAGVEHEVKVDAGHLINALRLAVDYTAPERDSRHVLHGVHLQARTEGLLVESGDGLRAFRLMLPVQGAVPAVDVVVPARLVRLLAGALKDEEGLISILLGEREIALAAGTVRLWARLLEGPFPSLDHVFTRVLENPYAAAVPVKALVDAVRRARIVIQGDRVERAHLIFGARTLAVCASSDTGESETVIEGLGGTWPEATTLTVNSRFLTDYLGQIPSAGTIVLRVADGRSPFALTGDGLPVYGLAPLLDSPVAPSAEAPPPGPA